MLDLRDGVGEGCVPVSAVEAVDGLRLLLALVLA